MKLNIATTLLALLPAAAFAKDILSFDGSTLRKKATSKKIGPLPESDETHILSKTTIPQSAYPSISGIASALCSEKKTADALYVVDLGDSKPFYCDEEGVGLVVNAASTEIAEHLKLKKGRRDQGLEEPLEFLRFFITTISSIICYFWCEDLKRDIHYLDETSRNQVGQMVLDMPLATWNYKSDSLDTPQRLGFMIDDIEPSFAVQDQIGNSVNTYGFISMATAAIQMQQEQIQELQKAIEALGVKIEVA